MLDLRLRDGARAAACDLRQGGIEGPRDPDSRADDLLCRVWLDYGISRLSNSKFSLTENNN